MVGLHHLTAAPVCVIIVVNQSAACVNVTLVALPQLLSGQ